MYIFIISLENSLDRRKFQKNQLHKLNLKFDFLKAVSSDNITSKIYEKHKNDWQRPLKYTEIACYFSHYNAWSKVVELNRPVLILEDDALLSNATPKILQSLLVYKNIDLVTLENRGRKKFVAKLGIDIGYNSVLLRLYQDRTGAAGYVLYPSGAKKLIRHGKKKGIALADAHITSCHSLKSYQVEPSPVVQLDYRKYYDIQNLDYKDASKSILGIERKPNTNRSFWFKRSLSQIKLGLRQLVLLIFSERRYIKLRSNDFYKEV